MLATQVGGKKPRKLSIQIPQGASGLGAGMVSTIAGAIDAESCMTQDAGQLSMGYEQAQVPTPGGSGMEVFPSPTQFLGVMTPNTMKEMQSFLVRCLELV